MCNETTMELDRPKEIRKGEALDASAILNYLQDHMPGIGDHLTIKQFPGGASNLTYMLEAGDREMVLRRPPFGAKIKSAHDMGREYRVLDALKKGYDKAPKPLLFCEDESIIGAPFYIMERVEGVIIRHDMGKELSPELVGRIAESLVETFVELHQLDYKKVGLESLGRPEGYIKRQVEGWTRRYYKSKTDEQKEIEAVSKWLSEHMPAESGHSLIHNDFKHDNVILDKEDLTIVKAILDWEMCTLGDPLMDLGTSLSYWMNPDDPELFVKSFTNPSVLPGNPTREGLLTLYEQKSGRTVHHPIFYYAFGLFKTAVVLQQIYYRYKMGHTQDPRFAYFNHAVTAFGVMAMRAIELKRIDGLV